MALPPDTPCTCPATGRATSTIVSNLCMCHWDLPPSGGRPRRRQSCCIGQTGNSKRSEPSSLLYRTCQSPRNLRPTTTSLVKLEQFLYLAQFSVPERVVC